MLNCRQWNRFRHQENALVVVSTKAGQNVIKGTLRLMRGVVRPTISDPNGVKRVWCPARIPNPLLVVNEPHSHVAPLNNAMRLNGKSKPTVLTAAFNDLCRHREAKKASE